jgi:hypothetical protein
MKRKPSIVAVACGLAFLAPSISESEPNKTALGALGTVLGAAEEAMAVMNHCRAVDPDNMEIYDGLGLRLLTLYTPYYEAADRILPGEGIKSGFPDGQRFRGAFLVNLRNLAQTEVKDLSATFTPAQDLATCRTQRDDFQKQRGLFAPPSTRFSAEVRIIDGWH